MFVESEEGHGASGQVRDRALLWLPSVVQVVFVLFGRVIECGLLSGLQLQPFSRPLAGMVIREWGPNLVDGLYGPQSPPGFPHSDLIDRLPIQVIAFSHLFSAIDVSTAPTHAGSPIAGSR